LIRTYKKRVAFLIRSTHFTVYSGIGQFAKTFCEMCDDMDIFVDIIVDQTPKSASTPLIEVLPENHKIISIDGHTYSKHNASFMFTESMNLELVMNFRDAMLKALESHVYDHVVCNIMEAVYGVYDLCLTNSMETMFYTHNENSIALEKIGHVFSDTYINLLVSMMKLPGLNIVTQDKKNASWLVQKNISAYVLPLLVTERELLKGPPDGTVKEGCLFIGRYEDRKNPESFIKNVKQAGVKPLVLTNEKGKESFIKRFAEEGITNYSILANVAGQEKVDFINSAQVSYHPSKLESFGYCAYETAFSCPTLLLDKHIWTDIHSEWAFQCIEESLVWQLMRFACAEQDTKKVERLKRLNEHHQESLKLWKQFFWERVVNIPSTPNPSKLDAVMDANDSFVKLNDFYFKHLKRGNICIEDVRSVLNKKYRYAMVHTKEDTYVSAVQETFVQDYLKNYMNTEVSDLFV